MRQKVSFSIEKDPHHQGCRQIVMRDTNGAEVVIVHRLKPQLASRMLLPIRKAFLAGIQWFRDDASMYVLATAPDVVLNLEEQ